MSQLLLTHSSQFHRVIRTRNEFPLSMRVGKFFLLFTMTFMIGLLSFFYLLKFTEIHTKGYQLRKLEVQRDRLVSAREEKSASIANAKALNSIRESDVAARMIPARSPIYIKEDGTFAKLPGIGNP